MSKVNFWYSRNKWINQNWSSVLDAEQLMFYTLLIFKCWNCSYVDKEDISYQVNEVEKGQRKKVEEIVKFLFSTNIPILEYPESSLNPELGVVSWGWMSKQDNTITLPRKTFYLPNEGLVDTVVHEASHLLSEIYHNRAWYLYYLKQREKVFKRFSDFAELSNPQAKFEKGYEIYPETDIID